MSVNLQGLLHDSLVATGHVECCTIIGRRDGAVKASSAGYEVWWTHSCLPHQAVKLPPPPHTHTHTHSPLLSRWMHSFPPLGRQPQLWIVAFTSMGPSTSVCGLIRTPFMPKRQVVSLTTLCMVLLWRMFPLQEGSGFVAVKTGSLIIFGSYSSVMFPSVCVEAVERLGEEHIS